MPTDAGLSSLGFMSVLLYLDKKCMLQNVGAASL